MKFRAALGALIAVTLAAASLSSHPAAADDNLTRTIVIKNHKFVPATLEVPAKIRVRLIIDNQDPTPEEFESHDLRREKILSGNSKGTVWVGPLPEGEYGFFGEFHQDTAQGTLIAK
ncbi:cupredoxin domain-containing protein [Rhodovibrio salinarum]|uniref:Cupredoxin domain-containing protein n=1 Tax=Rhodovibrio salinarum TaxID=1087 RepID=A0A934QK57_9PROT|nr:cupredoxin domain-containing protein [Rhodovibrio salinarum]MBK1698207.1 cupredoxin domain-containing protein [Rhodovibrio salinarum]